MSKLALLPRTRGRLLALALSLTLAGGVTAATRSTVPGVATVTASSPYESRALSEPDTEATVTTETTDTTATPETTAPPTTAKPRATTPTTAPVAVTNPATGTVLEPAEEGVYVLDLANGNLRKADNRGPFDVVGNTLYVAHGTTVNAMPIGGGASKPVMTVAGATDLMWIEMSQHDRLLTQWTTPFGENAWNVWRALVSPDGHVLNNDLVGERLEWSPDGSFFVVHDYRGLRAITKDNAALWGPFPAPEQYPYDLEFTPDAKHVIATFSQKSYQFDVATQQWSEIAARAYVSMSDNGQFATSPVPPPGWDGFVQLGTILTDLAGNSTKLTATGSEPIISPNRDHVLYIDEPLRRVGTRGSFTFRVATRDGKVKYTISKPGWELGRDAMRGGGPGGDGWLEGPQWSADGRYVVFGVYNPYKNAPPPEFND